VRPRLCAAAGLLALALAAPARAQEDPGLESLRRAHRSAKAAILMSIPVPGWGQLYADSPFWSAVAFSVQSFYLGHVLLERRRVERQRVLRDRLDPGSADRGIRDAVVQEHWERVRDFIWWSSGAMLLISLDAFVSVELSDFDANDPPTPDLDRDWAPVPSEGGDGAGLALRVHFSF